MNTAVKLVEPIEPVTTTAPHVLIAINAVMADIGQTGIAKDRQNEQQKYKFRGIDDVYNAIAPLLAKHHLIVKPRGLSRTCEERASKSGGVLFYVNVAMEFDLISAVDGSRETAGPFYGEAMDSGDKATNKAQSAAFKYFAMQQFVIPTEGDNDADGQTHEVEPREPLWVTAAHSAITCLTDEAGCGAWYKANRTILKEAEPKWRDHVLSLLKARKIAVTPTAPREPSAKADQHRAPDANPADPFDDQIPF